MKTIIVLCALASIGVAAPALSGDIPEVSKQTFVPAPSGSLDQLHREKKSPEDIASTTLPPTTEAEFVEHMGPSTAARSFLKKPVIIKKKHGYRLYRDSEEEKASADSFESCGRQVKVKLCDEDRKLKHSSRKSVEGEEDLHMTKDDVKHSIKMAKEAVEHLQRDLDLMENSNGMKIPDGSEADNELREDIEVARQALEHIHENFGNLETVSLRSTTSTDSEAKHDFRLTIARTDEERLAQWKEAMDNIHKNVEIARNIEQSLKMAGKEEPTLNLDQPEIEQNVQKVEENIGSQDKLISESHTRASDDDRIREFQLELMAEQKENNMKEIDENKIKEHNIEEDMKVSASEINSKITHAQGLDHQHLLRNGEGIEKNEHQTHEAPLGKNSIHDLEETTNFSEKQESISKIVNMEETDLNSPDLQFKSEDNENKENPQSSMLVKFENEEDKISEPSLHRRTHETEDISTPLTKSAEQLELATTNLATEDFKPSINIGLSEHKDTAARQSIPNFNIEHGGNVKEEATMDTGKMSEQPDLKSLDTIDQPDISMFVKSAIEDIQEQHKQIDSSATALLKSTEENVDINTDSNMQTVLGAQTSMRNVDEQIKNIHNDHKLRPPNRDEEFKHLNTEHMRESHLTEIPSIENLQDFTEDLHFNHMRNNISPNSHFMTTGDNANNFHLSHLRNNHFTDFNTMKTDEESNHNFQKENVHSSHISELPSMRAAEEHMKHPDHLRHSHLTHPLESTEDLDTQLHMDHLRTPHLDDFARNHPAENFHHEHLKHMEHQDHMLHDMGMGHNMEMGHNKGMGHESFSHHQHHQHHPHHPHHSHHHHDKFRQMNGMSKMHEMSGMANANFHASMRDAMEGFGSENRFRWQPAHESRGAYGPGAVGPAGAVGVFPNVSSGGCGIPLLLSCSPSVVSGSLAKPHSGYGAPAYRSDDEFTIHNKRDIKSINEMRSNNALRSANIIKQKTGTVLENKL